MEEGKVTSCGYVVLQFPPSLLWDFVMPTCMVAGMFLNPLGLAVCRVCYMVSDSLSHQTLLGLAFVICYRATCREMISEILTMVDGHAAIPSHLYPEIWGVHTH